MGGQGHSRLICSAEKHAKALHMVRIAKIDVGICKVKLHTRHAWKSTTPPKFSDCVLAEGIHSAKCDEPTRKVRDLL
jgi:hypothetical protein